MTSSNDSIIITGEKTLPIYFPGERDKWGQPPASRYTFNIEGSVMRGVIHDITTSSSGVLSSRLSSSAYSFVGLSTPSVEREPWESFSDEQLAALYAEAAEEDRLLAQLGLARYAEILRDEEEDESV